jgi:hypothetical protein
MSANLTPRSGSLPGMGAFCVGIAFILAATVLNIAHDRLPQFHMDKLPLYIGTLYGVAGKLGVTTLFVSLGILCLIAGAIYRGTARTRRAAIEAEQSLSVGASQPYFCTGQAAAPTVHSSGRIVLETWKYVTPNPNQTATQQ